MYCRPMTASETTGSLPVRRMIRSAFICAGYPGSRLTRGQGISGNRCRINVTALPQPEFRSSHREP